MIEETNEMIVDSIRQTFRVLEYTFFDNKLPYNLNIIGIRNNHIVRSGFFDDLIILIYRNKFNNWQVDQFEATTDAGSFYMQNPLNKNGTAILLEGQYKGAYQLGLHKGYEALIQSAPMKFVRDNNNDVIFNFNHKKVYNEIIGLNIHTGNIDFMLEENIKASAGCQVIVDPIKYKYFLALCRRSANLYGNSFTYTLIKEKDLLLF